MTPTHVACSAPRTLIVALPALGRRRGGVVFLLGSFLLGSTGFACSGTDSDADEGALSAPTTTDATTRPTADTAGAPTAVTPEGNAGGSNSAGNGNMPPGADTANPSPADGGTPNIPNSTPTTTNDPTTTGGTGGAPSAPAAGGSQTGGGPASGGTPDLGEGGAPGGTAGSGSGGSVTGMGGGDGNGNDANVDCNGLTSAPALEVASDGSATFDTIRAALDSLPSNNTTPTLIRIAPGTYEEKLVVDRPFITLCGQRDQTAATVLTYSDNANTPNGDGGTLGTSGSTSVHITADDVSVENLTFANSTGPGVQAVALLISSERVQFRNCRMLGYQDTLYVRGGSQYFRDCYVEGSVDFIFGGATAVFENCTIHSVANGSAITAPSTDEAVPYGIVFLGGAVTASPSVSTGAVALGRNWRPYGATAYLRTELGAHISSVGWVPMGENTLATARFSEYQTSGPGSNPGARAAESRQLAESDASGYTVENILGPWTPSFSQ